MSADDYLKAIIQTRKAPSYSLNDWRFSNILSIIREWAGSQLSEIKLSGSGAKGTAICGVADVDIFISLKSNTTQTLKELYTSLDNYVKYKGISTRPQNVSIRVYQNGLNIDLVPGKKQEGFHNFHSIYSSKKDTWMQTNIDAHITKIINSNRINEIILTKIWRENHTIDFPSIYLELTVIDALNYKSIGDIANNVRAVLNYLRDEFVESKVTDPSNSNNIISDSLYKYEKQAIAKKAEESLKKDSWDKIIW